MGFQLGVDLGTTYTAAAIQRGGRVEIVWLGDRTAVIPSVVFVREDGEIITGEAASRRGLAEPVRIAREFKRRIGDSAPYVVGGAALSAQVLTARLLRAVIDRVAEREGTYPDTIGVTHPANWGRYKLDLLQQAVAHAGFGAYPLLFLSEPEAAAIHYATHERVGPGAVIGVYDLGGGTFDAAVLRRTDDGAFDIIGRPDGVERLGGIDFDSAVLAHVDTALDGAFARLDPDDSSAASAAARLRIDCIEAKESLSSDVDVAIPVALPGLQRTVRLTRGEFEAMIRPAIAETITAMRRTLDSADIEATDVQAILLVGGSSRIPLVAQMVAAELGGPVAVDAHPKHAIAQGAAVAAAEHVGAADAESVTVVQTAESDSDDLEEPGDVGKSVARAPFGADPWATVTAPPSAPGPRPAGLGLTRLAVGVAVVALIAALAYTSLRPDDTPETTNVRPTLPPTSETDETDSETSEAATGNPLPPAGARPTTDLAILELFITACADGNLRACDELVDRSSSGTEVGLYGITCGRRLDDPVEDSCVFRLGARDGAVIEDVDTSGVPLPPPDPPPASADPLVQALIDDCHNGEMVSCDDLFFEGGDTIEAEEYGLTCGGRIDETDNGSDCATLFGP